VKLEENPVGIFKILHAYREGTLSGTEVYGLNSFRVEGNMLTDKNPATSGMEPNLKKEKKN
jgi:hypothetical protein